MAIDWSKVDEVTLALLNLTSFQDHGMIRSWKGHDWDVMGRLHEKGWIHDPVGKARSVVMTEEGVRRSEAFFAKHFGVDDGVMGQPGSPGSALAAGDERDHRGRGEPSRVVGLMPFVPSGCDFERSRALFRELGFSELWSAEGYVGLRCGAARFVLQALDEPAFAANLMIRIDVEGLDAWWQEVSARDLPGRFAGFRINPPAEFPWGREVHFIDLAGVCWHVGPAGQE